MRSQRLPLSLVLLLTVFRFAMPPAARAQGTLADYLRADSLGDRIQGLVVDIAERPGWIGESNRFWYRKSVEGGNSFVLVDAETQAKGPAFDHQRLAATLAGMATFAEDSVTALNLPFNRHRVHRWRRCHRVHRCRFHLAVRPHDLSVRKPGRGPGRVRTGWRRRGSQRCFLVGRTGAALEEPQQRTDSLPRQHARGVHPELQPGGEGSG